MLASLNSRASSATDIITAEISTASGTSTTSMMARSPGEIENAPSTPPSIPPPAARSCASWNHSVTAIEPRFRSPVASAIPTTQKNLPHTISRFAIGVDSSVSNVPRSFSPAVRSTAG